MAHTGPAPGNLRFGTFEVDLSAGELRKQGLRLRIQEQPFQVLAALLEHPGEVVTREELIRRLWADGTLVDFDRGLNAAVTRLRQVLSDSAETPRYVETVARRGYRFIAPVDVPDGLAPTAAEPALAPPPVRRRVWFWPALSALAVVVALVGWRVSHQPITQLEILALNVQPLTTEPGYERSPTFSPDGSEIAFEWDQGTGQPHIFIKVTGTGDPIRLTSASAPEYGPAWSRDGRQIAFLRQVSPDVMGVWVVPAVGGQERKIAEFAPIYWAMVDNVLRRMDWMPDNRHLVVSGAERAGSGERLFLVDAANGERVWLTEPGGPVDLFVGDREPAVSPDGRNVAFTRGGLAAHEILHVLSPSSDLRPIGEPRQLDAGVLPRNPVWTRDGREIVFVTGGAPKRIALDPGAVPREILGLGSFGTPAISQTGTLAFARGTRETNIYRQEVVARGAQSPPPVRLIASTANDQDARYSPDGTRIALQSNRSGGSEIWTCASDGTHCVQLTNINRPIITGTPRWSPDGKWIAFDSAWEGSFHVYVVSANGGSPRRVTAQQGAIPSWSRDGNWIYFAGQASGHGEIWKAPSTGGDAVRVTRNGGGTAFDSPDGKYLYFTKAENDTRLYRCAPDGSGETEVLNGVSRVSHRAFALAAEVIYYVRDEAEGRMTIRRFRLRTHEDSAIATLLKAMYLGLSLSPDGRYLIYSQVDREGSDLMIVDGFR